MYDLMEMNELVQLAKTDINAKNEVVKLNIGLVREVVWNKTGTEDEDLIAIGFRGILVAIDNYTEDIGCSFKTFAYNRIWSMLSNEFSSRRKDKRRANYGAISTQQTLGDEDGTEDTIEDTLIAQNGDQHGYGEIFKDETTSVLKAAELLESGQQKLFELRYIKGLGNEEISKILNCKKTKIDYQIRRLRRDLNDIMGLDYEIPGIKSVRKQKKDNSHLIQKLEF